MPQKEAEKVQMHNQNPNDEERLSKHEAEMLNSLLETSRGAFDFHGKKVAFITGPSGNRHLSKSDYFANIKDSVHPGNIPSGFIVLLTQEERNKSGGYDAFVLSWVKLFTKRQKLKIIEELGKNDRSRH